MTGNRKADTDRYSRGEYRRLIAWGSRIQREAPLFEALLADAPDRSVLDIGSGTGEHVAWFAERGARAVGVDDSPAMLEKAREHEARGAGRFLAGDALALGAALDGTGEGPFGLAICLGNMLPHLLDDGDLARFFGGVHAALRPGGLFLLQLLNYERIVAGGVRSLPVNYAEGDHPGEEIALLRFMRPISPTRLLFFPTTLTIDDAADPPVAIRNARRVLLRPWRAGEVCDALEASGFDVTLYGDMTRGGFDALSSHDVVTIAKRREAAAGQDASGYSARGS